MGTVVQSIQNSTLTILKNEVGLPIIITVPKISSRTTIDETNTITALISNMSAEDLGRSSLITINSLVCKIFIDDFILKFKKLTYNDIVSRKCVITYDSKQYSPVEYNVTPYKNIIILYLNRKV